MRVVLIGAPPPSASCLLIFAVLALVFSFEACLVFVYAVS